MANNYLQFSEAYDLAAPQAEFLQELLSELELLSDHADLPLSLEDVEKRVVENPGRCGPAVVAAIEYLTAGAVQERPYLMVHFRPTSEGVTVMFYTEESGDPETVVALLTLMARQFEMKGTFRLTYCYYCDKPRPREFGGGAVVWGAWSQQWLDVQQWAAEQS